MRRRGFYALGFGVLVLFDTLTQVSIKLASGHAGEITLTAGYLRAVLSSPWAYGALAGYLGAFVTWMTLLEHAPVGPAFAASHLEVVTVLVVSVPLFGEHLAPLQVSGALCIVAGIVLLSIGEAPAPRA